MSNNVKIRIALVAVILRKRSGRKGRGHGLDHYRWPNAYFADLGLFNLQQAALSRMLYGIEPMSTGQFRKHGRPNM